MGTLELILPFAIESRLKLAKIVSASTQLSKDIIGDYLFTDSRFISIGADTGEINVQEINRDEEKNEFYPFEVKNWSNIQTIQLTHLSLQIIAYKCNDETSFISGSAALIVDDINDNLPQIYFPDDGPIEIDEQTFSTLLSSLELYVEDIDLGPNAQYEVILTQGDGAIREFASAFHIVPGNGYQKQTFTVTVVDTDLIDFEVPEWQQFEITVSSYIMIQLKKIFTRVSLTD